MPRKKIKDRRCCAVCVYWVFKETQNDIAYGECANQDYKLTQESGGCESFLNNDKPGKFCDIEFWCNKKRGRICTSERGCRFRRFKYQG